jgi:hypothetical protein
MRVCNLARKKLGFTDLNLSTVGFSASSIDSGRADGYAHRDLNESIVTLHYWIVVALIFRQGHNERLIA